MSEGEAQLGFFIFSKTDDAALRDEDIGHAEARE